MINTNILFSIFKDYGINKVILVEDQNTCNFIVEDMCTNMPLKQWVYLEELIKDVTSKNINIMPKAQVLKIFPKDYLDKGKNLQCEVEK